jgi:hypothetical protein
VKRLELIGWMHRLADRVFDQAKLLGAIGYNFARNRVVFGNLLLLCQGLERGQPAATGDNLIGIGFRLGFACGGLLRDGQVLQETMNRNRGRKIVDGIRTGLSDVQAGSDELVKRNEGKLVTHRAPPRMKGWHCKRYCTYGGVTSRRKRQKGSLSGSCASL